MLKNLQGNLLDTKVSSTRVVGATPPVALYKFVTSTFIRHQPQFSHRTTDIQFGKMSLNFED